MPAAACLERFEDRSRRPRRSKGRRRPGRQRRISSSLLFAREVAQHHLPVENVVVERLDRNALVLAMGAEVDWYDRPGAVDAIDRHAGDPEWPGIAGARR